MQIRRMEWSIGVWSVAVAIAAGLAVCGVSQASAEECTGNQVFFKGGYVVMNSN
jgi:hypothetical protein